MSRIEKEKNTVRTMIEFYCRKKHNNSGLCKECDALWGYAVKRLENCPYGEGKKACKKCITPCYTMEKRMKIRKVMSYSGPRMLYCKPRMWLAHFFRS